MNDTFPGDSSNFITPIIIKSENFSDIRKSISFLGDYYIKEIKYGGMGQVYLCSYSENEEPTIALKTIQAKFFFEPNYRISFVNETLNWSRLSGLPHIMPVLGIEEIENSIYLILPCVKNKNRIDNFRDELSNNEIDINYKINHLFQCILGMNYANGKLPGLVHGDLKPENLMLLGNDIFITDFGLSKTIEELQNPQVKEKLDSTWAYKAPELWSADFNQTLKSDIYSIGIMLFETITGKLPFLAELKNDWKSLHTNKPPPIIVLNNKVHEKFLILALKCLSKVPEDRPNYNELISEFLDIYRESYVLDFTFAIYKQFDIYVRFQAIQEKLREPILKGLIKLNRPDLALMEIDNIKSENLSSEILYLKASCLSQVSKDEEAITIFETLLDQNLSTDLRFKSLNELGLSYKRTKKFQEAEDIYLKKLLPSINNDKVVTIIGNLATVYLQKGDYKKVISTLTNLLIEYPGSGENWANLGMAYFLENDFSNAAISFQRAIALKPTLMQIQVKLAETYIELNRLDESFYILDSVWDQGYCSELWLENMIVYYLLTSKNNDAWAMVEWASKDIGEEEAIKIFNKSITKIQKILDKKSK